MIVYIQTGQLGIPGHTAFLKAAAGARLVRITISDALDLEDRRLAWLGHELQHAVEVAANPAIVSAAAMQQFLILASLDEADNGHGTPSGGAAVT